MTGYSALRDKPALANYKKGDVLVLFGELFNRGYANGLVEEAQKRGLKVIYATVGRREKDGQLRPLNEEELANAPKPLINIPLEAGFDLEPSSNTGQSPVDLLKDIKLSGWSDVKLDWASIESSRALGTERFRKNVQSYLKELSKHIQPGQNVLFAHLMAGGVPRAKIVMPLMNRVFKGVGDRNLASKEFWNSDLGQLCQKSFSDVTAGTFKHLIELSQQLRKMIEASNGHVSYVAYGYHGTEVLLDSKYQWQTYTPYLQGWAKMELEQASRDAAKLGIHCCVYNCPEILTNSSSIFQGVEVCLYPLIQAFQKEVPQAERTQKIFNQCQSLLKEGVVLDDLYKKINHFAIQQAIIERRIFNEWPQHSSQEQMDLMLKLSDELVDLHKDPKQLILSVLSEIVFESCGYVMFHDSWSPKAPVQWINHDVVARSLVY